MPGEGIIIFIDDDKEEQDLFKERIAEFCNREIKFASDGVQGLALVKTHLDDIFMIVSDINMPKMTGLELKRIIEGKPELKLKSIPFVFHTSMDNPVIVKEAFALGIQGFLLKTAGITQSVAHLRLLIDFWESTVHPNMKNIKSEFRGLIE